MSDDLADVRRQIDDLDNAVQALLERRVVLVQLEADAVGTVRRDEARELQVVERLQGRVRKFPRRAVAATWAAIIAGCAPSATLAKTRG